MDAAELQRIKDLLPTSLGSEEIREQIAADILRRSVFSARMESARYLAQLREITAQIVAGEINQARARELLLGELSRMGHSPLDGGGITNPASITRLNLIVDTQRQMAASAANMMNETPGTLAAFPAYELVRMVGKQTPRPDWAQRWAAAGTACGFEGALQDRFMALKSSPIWQRLGDGEGGWRDTLGNPFPPFAFNSGMAWRDVPADEARRAGLVPPAEMEPQRPVLTPGERDIAEAAERLGFADMFADLEI